tara:strand:- start:560 stop:931 length:372 start_codon:yes stop_codon:yes gene_type:complete
MGGKSSSSTSQATTSKVTNENISDVDGTVFNETGDVTLTDLNSIDRSFQFAGDGLRSILDFGTGIINNQQLQLTDTLRSINAANNSTVELSNISEDESNQKIIRYVTIGAVVLGAFWLIRGRK